MRFRAFCENVVAGPNDLPQILPGMVRMTHFTSKGIGDHLLSSGEGFRYTKHGLAGTTDSFSNNNDVFGLIQSGSTGAFTRDGFGDCVVLMDMPNDEHRIHRTLTSAPGQVDNRQIVGYVNRQTMDFVPNRNYNPQAVQLQVPNQRLSSYRDGVPKPKIPMTQQPPQPTAAPPGSVPDVW